jgi:hypothetical protein
MGLCGVDGGRWVDGWTAAAWWCHPCDGLCLRCEVLPYLMMAAAEQAHRAS